jgi:hypothetical protein
MIYQASKALAGVLLSCVVVERKRKVVSIFLLQWEGLGEDNVHVMLL